jgi:hypothetical protein
MIKLLIKLIESRGYLVLKQRRNTVYFDTHGNKYGVLRRNGHKKSVEAKA